MSTAPSPQARAPLAARVGPWPVRVLWLLQPLVCGPTYARALDGRLESVQTGVSLALWVTWGLVLGATLIPRTVTLTLIRLALPASVLSLGWAAATADLDALTVAGLAITVMGACALFLPATADAFVNGSSYGDERRMPLRTPAMLLVGPAEVAWLASVAGFTVGPLLILAHQWLVGAVALVVGVPLAVLAVRALHGLAQRWIVFVPAGVVLHDAMAVADPVLFTRRSVGYLGPADADTSACDLTLGALGLALEVRVDPPVPLTFGRLSRAGSAGGAPAAGDREAEVVSNVLFTPTQPGEVLREAARRSIGV